MVRSIYSSKLSSHVEDSVNIIYENRFKSFESSWNRLGRKIIMSEKMARVHRSDLDLGERRRHYFNQTKALFYDIGVHDIHVYIDINTVNTTSVESNFDDPFSISLADFLNLDYDKAIELQNEVSKRCAVLLKTAWEKGKRQIVICEGKIIYETEESEDIPNELVTELTNKHKKSCYVFSAPDKVEECVWTGINEHDSYPTICLHIGTPDSQEVDLIQNSPIETDFDTGNPDYRIFDADNFPKPLTTFTTLDLRQGMHLGGNYSYFQKKVKICVKDVRGKTYSIIRNIRLIKNWKDSPLLQASPNRHGFVGRDILRDLGIKIELDPSKKITRVLGS